jgi:hypothetical protein
MTCSHLPEVGGRNRHASGGFAWRFRSLAVALLGAMLTACAATQAPDAVAHDAGTPGFLLGLWHGFIFPVAWIVSLFVDKVAVYAVPNNGGWYDFGYFLGIVVFGVGARKGGKTVTVYRDRGRSSGPVIDSTATRID